MTARPESGCGSASCAVAPREGGHATGCACDWEVLRRALRALQAELSREVEANEVQGEETRREYLGRIRAEARADAAEAALATEKAIMRAHWEVLQNDVEKALAHHEQKGGQHAGTARLMTAPPSLLSYLALACRDALAALEAPR